MTPLKRLSILRKFFPTWEKSDVILRKISRDKNVICKTMLYHSSRSLREYFSLNQLILTFFCSQDILKTDIVEIILTSVIELMFTEHDLK